MAVSMVYADLPDIDRVVPRSSHDEPLFEELAAVLEKYGALKRFGIMLLHTHFEVQPGEVLLETTDRSRREQRITPVRLGEIDGLEVTETAWRLGPGGNAELDCACVTIQGQHVHHHRQ